MRMSKSKMNDYLNCPRQFKYKYIDNLPYSSGDAARRGTVIHELAENVANALMQEENITTDVIKRYVSIYYDDSEFDIEEDAQSLVEFFRDVLINDGCKIVSAEQEIYDPKLDIKGFVDLILEDEFGNYVIIDYKSGSVKPITQYLRELCVYKYLVEYKYPDKKVTTAGIFFTKGNQYRMTNFTESQKKGCYTRHEDYLEVFTLIAWIRYMIDTEQFHPKRSYLCKFCSFEDRCKKDGGL